MGLKARDVTAWRGQLARFLPTGAAWNFRPGGMFDRLLGGFAEGFARADRRIDTILDEAIPTSALEMLPDWEATVGLPDACTGTPANVDERRVAVKQRLTSTGGQSRAYFIGLAASLGYAATIEELWPARVGRRVGVRCGSPAWAYVWRMRVALDGSLPNAAIAKVGSRVGVRLRGWGSLDLECVIRRHAPAHTTVLFAYGE